MLKKKLELVNDINYDKITKPKSFNEKLNDLAKESLIEDLKKIILKDGYKEESLIVKIRNAIDNGFIRTNGKSILDIHKDILNFKTFFNVYYIISEIILEKELDDSLDEIKEEYLIYKDYHLNNKRSQKKQEIRNNEKKEVFNSSNILYFDNTKIKIEIEIEDNSDFYITIKNCPHKINNVLKSQQFYNYKYNQLFPSPHTFEEYDGTYSIRKGFKIENNTFRELLLISHLISMNNDFKDFKTIDFIYKIQSFFLDFDVLNDEDGNRKYYLNILNGQINGFLNAYEENKLETMEYKIYLRDEDIYLKNDKKITTQPMI